MAIFTAIAAFILAGTALAGTFAVPLLAGAISIGASIGVSYIAKALAGNPNGNATPEQGVQGVQGTLQSGADVPRSFNVGYSVTAGSLVYANTWGNTGNTPNAFLTQVIALSDLPGGILREVWVNGELCTLTTSAPGSGDPKQLLQDALNATIAAGISFFTPEFNEFVANYISSHGGSSGTGGEISLGLPVVEYRKDGQDYLWIKYYDGSQTTADDHLVSTVSSADRPYNASRVGTGVAYVVVTSLVNDTLFSGFPSFKFAVSGIPLYDPTKDSTNGGTGTHRYSDPTTWGGDGDDFPAVQAYNILRGIHFNGVWLYGLQRMTAARLPAINWNAQIAKCRSAITGVSGNEPTYRTGGQVSVNVQTVNTIEAILTGCQGRVSEIGGFYKIHIGSPDSPSFAFTDDDIISTEEQHFAPFFGLADSVNGIATTYPSPGDGWNAKAAPPLYSSTFETEDGSRRLMANPSLDFVPYDAQVQRLQKSALQEARRARRHSITLPPAFWVVEPGDVGEWTSTRNGYATKQFRVDGITDKANLDVLFNITEVDPADFDFNHDTDFTPVGVGPTVFPRPAPQGVIDFFAESYTLLDTAGLPRRPAIRIVWDGSVAGVSGVQFEVRLASDETHVTRGRTDQLSVGSIVVSQALLPDTEYEVRAQYLPSSPRDMLWSDWLPITTPDIRLSVLDFDTALRAQVTTIQDAFSDKIAEIEQRIATLSASNAAQNWLDKKEVRSQLFATAGHAAAEIDEVRSVAVSATEAIATLSTSVSATFGNAFSSVATVTDAVATLDGFAASRYAITLDTNGFASGFELVNGGQGFSAATFLVDKFQIASPGISGGDPIPVFTVANVAGVPKIGLRGDMFIDGSITASMINVGTLSAISITSQNGKMIVDLSNNRIEFFD
jgi:hypothetical protein